MPQTGNEVDCLPTCPRRSGSPPPLRLPNHKPSSVFLQLPACHNNGRGARLLRVCGGHFAVCHPGARGKQAHMCCVLPLLPLPPLLLLQLALTAAPAAAAAAAAAARPDSCPCRCTHPVPSSKRRRTQTSCPKSCWPSAGSGGRRCSGRWRGCGTGGLGQGVPAGVAGMHGFVLGGIWWRQARPPRPSLPRIRCVVPLNRLNRSCRASPTRHRTCAGTPTLGIVPTNRGFWSCRRSTPRRAATTAPPPKTWCWASPLLPPGWPRRCQRRCPISTQGQTTLSRRQWRGCTVEYPTHADPLLL